MQFTNDRHPPVLAYTYGQNPESSINGIPGKTSYPPPATYSPNEYGQMYSSYGSGSSTPTTASSSYRGTPLPTYPYPSSPSSSFYGYNNLPNPHEIEAKPISSVAAVPPPVPKVAYAPPVFQTFQERKKARDTALRANSSHSKVSGSPSLPSMPPPPLPVSTQCYRSPSPLPMTPPSASTVAMMGQPGLTGGLPPAPPSRSNTRQTGPAPSDCPRKSHSRPLPPPRGRTPLSINISSSSSSSAAPTSPFKPTRSGPTSPMTAPFVSSSPAQNELDRSDTVSSIKSLDRNSFISPSKRPLPKTPGGVNPSRSLDRGMSSQRDEVDESKRTMNRKQPSVVNEESEEALADAVEGMSLSSSSVGPSTPTRSHSPQSPTILVPVIESSHRMIDRHTPAKFTPLPAISVGDSDASSVVSSDEEDTNNADKTPKAKKSTGNPSSPGIQITGAPMITVSSTDTAEFDQGGEISFSVPTISVGEVAPPTNTVPFAPTPAHLPASSRPVQTRIHPGSAIICAGCNNPIIGRIVNAMSQRWHPQCFGCAECGELLEHVSSFEFEGRAYCHLDYHDKFANRCHHCKTPIVESRFITLNDDALGQRYYHELHFFCSECGDPFLDPSKSSAPGTERERQNVEDEEDGETNDFVIHKGHPYCEHCHLRLHKPKCKACKEPIRDIAVTALGSKWHKECFVCTRCNNDFANDLFFPKDGKAFCTSCYEELML